MKVETFITLFRNAPLEVCVEAEYTPGQPPRWAGRMEGSEPGEGPQVEIISVRDEDGDLVELTDSEYEDAVEKILEEQQ